MPWTNHIYIEYELYLKWPPPPLITTPGLTDAEKLPDLSVLLTQQTKTPPSSPTPTPDGSSNIHYSILVKGIKITTYFL